MTELRFGLSPTQWQAAREEIGAVLAEAARHGETLTYTDLVGQVRSARLDPHDYAVAHLLGEVSTEDHDAGRGMRSALVVSKDGNEPGTGFFALARALGEDVSDPMRYWIEQTKRVYADWAAP